MIIFFPSISYMGFCNICVDNVSSNITCPALELIGLGVRHNSEFSVPRVAGALLLIRGHGS